MCPFSASSNRILQDIVGSDRPMPPVCILHAQTCVYAVHQGIGKDRDQDNFTPCVSLDMNGQNICRKCVLQSLPS